MNVNPAASVSAAGATGTSSDPASQANDMFLQLLMAQLKSQSPLDPVDPNQFVGQLVQFNTLDQLIQIRELLQEALQIPATGTSTQATQGAH
ncbi:MAG TPA: flagellar hook capping FlgD N-terminal domain-containing protein [Terriglobales bacterium]|jgi:flagellar basal-body rod modification protein FlgD|nr:flagellar hook capping FlgD N-terminal domain-containing protein [Terriglobales bacterium]